MQGNEHMLVVWRPDMSLFTINMIDEVNTSVPADPNIVSTMVTDRE